MEKHAFELWSPQLRNHRTVDVYLPETYNDGRRRYPTVYMQDGQNLSDPSTAFGGKTWSLDDGLAWLAERGIEPIVVGLHNTPGRLAEYSPFPDAKHGGGDGDRYARFLIDTVKARIDSASAALITGAKLTMPRSFLAPSITTSRHACAERFVGDQRRSGSTPPLTAESP